jgi:hypothetical protein
MIELGLLGVLIFVLVYSITLLRRTPENSEEEFSNPDAQSGDRKDNSNVEAPSTGSA